MVKPRSPGAVVGRRILTRLKLIEKFVGMRTELQLPWCCVGNAASSIAPFSGVLVQTDRRNRTKVLPFPLKMGPQKEKSEQFSFTVFKDLHTIAK